ncbi:MAG: ribosome biogenesis GTPase Der, partial [Candidatus Competibacterales bacterium]|nr:ribosome biogenesis GTPase Der [Candidatus Competibacterales bacterium]
MAEPAGPPVIALVGRPNVGKSTLFNALTRTRDALVADFPGLTRDRQYGLCHWAGRTCIVVDTGGLVEAGDPLAERISAQALAAARDADAVLLLVDGRAGLTGADQSIAGELRRLGRPLFLVVNKSEGLDPDLATSEFHALGLGQPLAIAAAHRQGVSGLLETVLATLPVAETPPQDDERIRLAVVGRPNVGKSTLINRLLGEERMLASDLPGTTRDSVQIPFSREKRHFTLIDTAGVRRRSRVHEAIEKFSVLKTLAAIEQAHVVLLMLDARQGIAEQDASLLGHVLDSGRALVIAVNKWDRLESDVRERTRAELDRRLGFVDFARVHFISALHGSGVIDLLDSVVRAHDAAGRSLSTPELTRILEQAVNRHPPPLVQGQRIKLRYAHQGGHHPPR